MQNKYITQLTENDIIDLGKTLTGKSSTRVKDYKFVNDILNVEYRIDRNAPKGTSVMEHAKIFKVNAIFNDFSLDGGINTFYPLSSERFFEKFIGFMINRFGKEYAKELYEYHKKIIDEIDAIATLMKSREAMVNENPMVLNLIKIKSTNLQTDYAIKLKELQSIINNNLYGNDKIYNFDILNNI